MKNLLKIENITKEYNVAGKAVVALNNLSLEVNHGDCIAIVGESGSGKTTLARMILGLEYPTAGNIIFDEINITRKRNRKNRKEIQVVQQNPLTSLNPKKKIFSTIALPLKIHNIVENRNLAAKVKELLLSVDLPENLQHRFPASLSGGQRQRVAIARAIASNPKILVLDEPTSALDVTIQSQILNLLNDLQNKYELTYIFISHDLNVIKAVSDYIIVMKNGRIVEEGKKDDIIKNARTKYTQSLLQASL